VLVKETIPISSIISVCFKTGNESAEAKAAMSDFNTKQFTVEPEIFLPSRKI